MSEDTEKKPVKRGRGRPRGTGHKDEFGKFNDTLRKFEERIDALTLGQGSQVHAELVELPASRDEPRDELKDIITRLVGLVSINEMRLYNLEIASHSIRAANLGSKPAAIRPAGGLGLDALHKRCKTTEKELLGKAEEDPRIAEYERETTIEPDPVPMHDA